jgi:hypothetical protein
LFHPYVSSAFSALINVEPLLISKLRVFVARWSNGLFQRLCSPESRLTLVSSSFYFIRIWRCGWRRRGIKKLEVNVA